MPAGHFARWSLLDLGKRSQAIQGRRRGPGEEVHAAIRALLAGVYGESVAQSIRILYGGSVKPGNAAELMAQGDIDGALVGGASLVAKDFFGIISAAAEAIPAAP